MSRTVPSPVWRCVSENRQPRPLELDSMTTRILQEAFNGDESATAHYQAELLAQAALEGDLGIGSGRSAQLLQPLALGGA